MTKGNDEFGGREHRHGVSDLWLPYQEMGLYEGIPSLESI